MATAADLGLHARGHKVHDGKKDEQKPTTKRYPSVRDVLAQPLTTEDRQACTDVSSLALASSPVCPQNE